VALTDSTPQNGCLRVLPGSHRRPRLPHHFRPHRDNLLGSGLHVAGGVDESRVVAVQLRAGEMSLHHVDLVHGSDRNDSDVLRAGFAVRYTTAEVSQTRRHHAVILARGRRPDHFALGGVPPPGLIADGLRAQRDLARWGSPP
jgi:ectoine hydroxylase-related dioxygenase (phytanoyl-CoA dioxygenase family)